MPSSNEIFGGTSAESMLSGEQRDMSHGMFNPAAERGGPTPEELERDFERALHTKHVRLKKVSIKTFDLSKPEEKDEYCKLCVSLYNNSSSGQTVVQQHERKFLEQPNPRYIVHIEWWEYALVVDGKELTPEEFEAWKKLTRNKENQGADNGS